MLNITNTSTSNPPDIPPQPINTNDIISGLLPIISNMNQKISSITENINNMTARNEHKHHHHPLNPVFPGSSSDLIDLVPVMTGVSRCETCSTCQKNGVCTANTYKILQSIINKYGNQWSPPHIMPKNVNLNYFLLELLRMIITNLDLNCPSVHAWLMDPKLKHLLNPTLLMNAQLSSRTPNLQNMINEFNSDPYLSALMNNLNQVNNTTSPLINNQVNPIYSPFQYPDNFNFNRRPAFQQSQGIDPMLMLNLMGNQNSYNNPALLPFLLAQGNISRHGDKSNIFLPMILSMMNSNYRKPVQAAPVPVHRHTCGMQRTTPAGTYNCDPLMLTLLTSGATDLNQLMLMLMMKNSNMCNQACNNHLGQHGAMCNKGTSKGCEYSMKSGKNIAYANDESSSSNSACFDVYRYGGAYGRH